MECARLIRHGPIDSASNLRRRPIVTNLAIFEKGPTVHHDEDEKEDVGESEAFQLRAYPTSPP